MDFELLKQFTNFQMSKPATSTVLDSESVDAQPKNWVLSFRRFAVWAAREGKMPPVNGSSDECLFTRGAKFAYTQGKLEDWQMRLLWAAGFVFDTHIHNFTINVKELSSLLQGTGLSYLPGTNGPYKKLGRFQWRINNTLGKFAELGYDLGRYKEWLQEEAGDTRCNFIALTQGHLDIIEEYELVFHDRPTVIRRTREEIDESHRVWCGKLRQFKEEYGHFDVPHHWVAPLGYVGLYHWFHDVRLHAFDRPVYRSDYEYPETDDDSAFIYHFGKMQRD